MINECNVAVGHVSGSHQLRRVHDEVVTFTVIGQCLLESSAVCSDSEASVENCALTPSLPRETVRATVGTVRTPSGRRERPRGRTDPCLGSPGPPE